MKKRIFVLLNKIINKIFSGLHKIRVYIFLLKCSGTKKKSDIDFPVKFKGRNNIEIGNNVSINAFVHIWGQGGVKIGNEVMIATHTVITSLTHDYSYKEMRFAPIISKPVIIEDDVWIGSDVSIMPGVTIGRGAVVGAGSVVTKDVPPMVIIVGSPAKILKHRKILH